MFPAAPVTAILFGGALLIPSSFDPPNPKIGL